MISRVREDPVSLLKELLEQMTRYDSVRRELPPFDVYGEGFDKLLDTKPKKAMVNYFLNRTGTYTSDWPMMIKQALTEIARDRQQLSKISLDLYLKGETELSEELDIIAREV